MKLINKIKKWFRGPILYNEYMNNSKLTIQDLNDYELNDIKIKLNLLLKHYNIQVSEEVKCKHINKELNIFDIYEFSDFIMNSKYYQKYLEIKNKFGINDYELQKLRECNSIEEFKEYLYYMIRFKLRLIKILPTNKEILKYLDDKILLNQIRDVYEEIAQDGNTEEECTRIMNDIYYKGISIEI